MTTEIKLAAFSQSEIDEKVRERLEQIRQVVEKVMSEDTAFVDNLMKGLSQWKVLAIRSLVFDAVAKGMAKGMEKGKKLK